MGFRLDGISRRHLGIVRVVTIIADHQTGLSLGGANDDTLCTLMKKDSH
jgi:hypothetical protein